MIGILNYKGYQGSIEYCSDDKILFGRVLGMGEVSISYHADSIKELESAFELMVNDYLTYCETSEKVPIKPQYIELQDFKIPVNNYNEIVTLSNKLDIGVLATIEKAINTLKVATL